MKNLKLTEQTNQSYGAISKDLTSMSWYAREKRTEDVFEEIIVNNFPKLIVDSK